MNGQVAAESYLGSVPTMVSMVVVAALHHIGVSDMACAAVAAAIIIPGTTALVLLMRHWRKQDGEKR